MTTHSASFELETSVLKRINFRSLIGLVVMGIVVISSALGVVYTKYLNRRLHIQLQQVQNERDRLHVEWTQLLLEQGTLGSDVRVEKIAREKLGMTVPSSKQIIVIKP